MATALSSGLSAADSYSVATYPYDCVCYIVATYSDGTSEQGSGAIVGAHSVLTASHLLWNADLGQAAASVSVYLEFPNAIIPVPGQYIFHYYQVDDAGGMQTLSNIQTDYAQIDFSADLSGYGSFGIQPDYTSGLVHLTGYPASAGGLQSDQIGTIVKDASYAVLDYGSVSASPGNSGGPVWIDQGTAASPLPYVVGVVSTDGAAVQITSADLQTLSGWQSSDLAQLIPTGSQTVLHARTGVTDVEGSSGADTITGWSGGDYLRGNDGNDSIIGGSGFDDINGNKGADTIDGGLAGGSDWLVGGQGNDLISAHFGNGLLYGNLGDDTLSGGVGSEILRGGQGNDVIFGGAGADFISGDRGADTLTGGSGADIFHSAVGAGIDQVKDFHQAQGDYVLLDAGSTYSAAQVGADTVVTIGGAAAGDQMILTGVTFSSLTAGWIVVAV